MTAEEREQLCREYLPRVIGVLRRTLGPDAEEFAGVALLEAVDKYDPEKGKSFASWVDTVAYRVAVREFRKIHGRKESSKYQATVNVCELDANDRARDTPTPQQITDRKESFIEALRLVDAQPAPRRQILMLQTLAGLSREAQSRVLGIPRKRLGRAVA